ncbi:Fur family transcriptional regulator [Gemmiger sp.]|uniref:Fur family transcriptional regulator n=1 Tax=Gemmiger sp. TaxID=2049027 RepID=UPI003F02E0C4|nr:transcriptional repressor [bacterium]MCI6249591.1 transcriptional repressor [bacterium]
MRYSHQRELILREVLSREDHPTAEQICTSLRSDCPRLSLGTVYRDLNTLVDIGKIRRVSIPGEADRFEGPAQDHQHLYCRSCHKVESIHIPDDQLKVLVDACPGIKAEDFTLTVFGLCSECAAKQNA